MQIKNIFLFLSIKPSKKAKAKIGDEKMKISWIKAKQDTRSFRIPKNMGLDVFEIEDLEQTDHKIEELVQNKYNTIILSNDVAGFSEDIIKKYAKNEEINIIIAPRKKE